ncbi:hypothetical protein Hanom_Chr12g01068071 [Helianthus anomalus]
MVVRREVKVNTSTSAASFRGIAPTMEGETATSLAPAIMAASLHPSLICTSQVLVLSW